MVKNFSDLFTTIGFWIPKVSLSVLLVICGIAPSFARVERVEILDAIPNRNNSQVKLRVKVYDRNNKPVTGLQKEDVNLIVCPPQGDPEKGECQILNQGDARWRVPLPEELPPAWVIVLLDLSGSMKGLDGDGRQTKLAGAIEAIRQLDRNFERTGAATKIAIAPFGEGGGNCQGIPVSDRELDNFKPAGSLEIAEYLDFLESEVDNLCAATDIYEPLRTAVRFLGNPNDKRFNPPRKSDEIDDSQEPQPRLSIILLSDGYHSIYYTTDNEAKREQQDFELLLSVLNNYPNLAVHTLGYGKTPQELQREYNLDRIPNIDNLQQLGQEQELDRIDFASRERLQKIVRQEFVDQSRLKRIATVTRGIHKFSGNANDVAYALTEFLNAMQEEYEITYVQPKADRASSYNVRVLVYPPDGQTSPAKNYTFPWTAPSPPFKERGMVLLSVLAGLLGLGFIPFWLWSKSMKP